MVNLDSTLRAIIALGSPELLLNKDFPIPISFIYGDADWVQRFEEDIAWEIVKINKFCGQDSPECGLKISKVHVIPTSDHNMHIDNPNAMAQTLINDIYNTKIEVLPNP